MNTQETIDVMKKTIDELSDANSLKGLFHQHRDGNPMPSNKALEEIIELSRAILFPGFFGKSTVNINTLSYSIGINIERLHKLLAEQIHAGLCFADTKTEESYEEQCEQRDCALEKATKLIAMLPKIRATLATDVEAAYNGDPAAVSQAEIVACYPIIKALVPCLNKSADSHSSASSFRILIIICF